MVVVHIHLAHQCQVPSLLPSKIFEIPQLAPLSTLPTASASHFLLPIVAALPPFLFQTFGFAHFSNSSGA